jgi:hypothetical protein
MYYEPPDMQHFQAPVTSSHLGQNILTNVLFSNTFVAWETKFHTQNETAVYTRKASLPL